jgi:ubiquinol-cytochrome c reductase iron-sulfur subunit
MTRSIIKRKNDEYLFFTHTEIISKMSVEGATKVSADSLDDKSKRRFLVAATTVVGGIGAGFAAVPFILSMQPSAKAQAAGAPVEVDISKIEPGEKITVEWRGKPVWIVKRTQENLDDLASVNDRLRDVESNESEQPEYAKNLHRSIKPALLVVIGICTHLGCSPTYVKKHDPKDFKDDAWKGGFFCPCHGSLFDLAGRVYQGVPAPTNLVVPPYTFLSDTRILVGADEKGAA